MREVGVRVFNEKNEEGRERKNVDEPSEQHGFLGGRTESNDGVEEGGESIGDLERQERGREGKTRQFRSRREAVSRSLSSARRPPLQSLLLPLL